MYTVQCTLYTHLHVQMYDGERDNKRGEREITREGREGREITREITREGRGRESD